MRRRKHSETRLILVEVADGRVARPIQRLDLLVLSTDDGLLKATTIVDFDGALCPVYDAWVVIGSVVLARGRVTVNRSLLFMAYDTVDLMFDLPSFEWDTEQAA